MLPILSSLLKLRWRRGNLILRLLEGRGSRIMLTLILVSWTLGSGSTSLYSDQQLRITILCLNIEYIKNKVSGWRFTLKSLFFTPRNASFWLFFCRLLLDYFNKMKSRLHPFSLNQINYQQALVLNDIITNVIILTQCMYVYIVNRLVKNISNFKD